MLNRRAFMGAVGAAALATFIRPAPRRTVDLSQFCLPAGHWRNRRKFDLHLPFWVDDYTYATDARVCVRVRPALADVADHEGAIPPFHTLSWSHDKIRGWRELPKLEPVLMANNLCPACDGTGNEGGVIGLECPECEGAGDVMSGNGYDIGHWVQCPKCKGLGSVRPAGVSECLACRGNAIGIFPGAVILDGMYFDAKLYRKVQALGGEYVRDNFKCIPSQPMLKFRFAEGDGLVMALDTISAQRRHREALKA